MMRICYICCLSHKPYLYLSGHYCNYTGLLSVLGVVPFPGTGTDIKIGMGMGTQKGTDTE